MPAQTARGNGIAVIGGSFNPLHIGHMRLAFEVYEALGSRISHVELLPCAQPPHKKASDLLPFDFRCRMLEHAAAPYHWLTCNPMEAERSALSYTWDTLGIYAERHPGTPVYFVLGSQDYSLLPTWFRGLEIPLRCTPVVLPRGSYSAEDFTAATRAMWPGAQAPEREDSLLRMRLSENASVLFLAASWLEISSTLIRERLLCGRSTDFLIPQSVAEDLRSNLAEVRRHWGKSDLPD